MRMKWKFPGDAVPDLSSTAHLSFGLGDVSVGFFCGFSVGDPCFSFFYSWGNEGRKKVG